MPTPATRALAAMYRPTPRPPVLWVKWYAVAPVGYVATGVYCPSNDSYLYQLAP